MECRISQDPRDGYVLRVILADGRVALTSVAFPGEAASERAVWDLIRLLGEDDVSRVDEGGAHRFLLLDDDGATLATSAACTTARECERLLHALQAILDDRDEVALQLAGATRTIPRRDPVDLPPPRESAGPGRRGAELVRQGPEGRFVALLRGDSGELLAATPGFTHRAWCEHQLRLTLRAAADVKRLRRDPEGSAFCVVSRSGQVLARSGEFSSPASCEAALAGLLQLARHARGDASASAATRRLRRGEERHDEAWSASASDLDVQLTVLSAQVLRLEQLFGSYKRSLDARLEVVVKTCADHVREQLDLRTAVGVEPPRVAASSPGERGEQALRDILAGFRGELDELLLRRQDASRRTLEAALPRLVADAVARELALRPPPPPAAASHPPRSPAPAAPEPLVAPAPPALPSPLAAEPPQASLASEPVTVTPGVPRESPVVLFAPPRRPWQPWLVVPLVLLGFTLGLTLDRCWNATPALKEPSPRPQTAVPGPASPPPPKLLDSDGDGLYDPGQVGVPVASIDSCPAVPGPRDNQGCPPDADLDGVPDADDTCPDAPETLNDYQDRDGCPDELPAALAEIRGVLQGIEFNVDDDTILDSSSKTLDRVVKVLREFHEPRVEISGHTDSDGVRAYNIDLSLRRAGAVKSYFVKAGLDGDRFEVVGYGPDRPIADNTTNAGKGHNRRIELRLLDGAPLVRRNSPTPAP